MADYYFFFVDFFQEMFVGILSAIVNRPYLSSWYNELDLALKLSLRFRVIGGSLSFRTWLTSL